MRATGQAAVGELVRESMDRPLCPGSLPPVNTHHRVEVTFQDRLYDAFKPLRVNDAGEPDTDGELPPHLDEVYSKVAYSETYSRMYLHTEQTSYVKGRQLVTVEAHYWKCHLCGQMLPATTVEKRP